MFSKTAFCGALLTQIVAGVVHEEIVAVPAGWEHVGAASSTAIISLQVALSMQNIDQLESKLLSVSTPGSAQYGKYLDIDDVDAIFKPTTASSDAVIAWLNGEGVTSAESDGYFVKFSTTVETANKVLNTTFNTYQNNGQTKIRATQYSVPDGLSAGIDLIDPILFIGNSQAHSPSLPIVPKRAKRATNDYCTTELTPNCVNQINNIGDYVPDVKSGSRIGFSSFLNQSASYTDLTAFEDYYKIPLQNFTVELVNGGINYQTTGFDHIQEANLDVQNIVAAAHPLPVTEFIVGGSPPFIPDLGTPVNRNEPYIPYYQYLLSKPNSELPQVISNSYGDDEVTVPYNYAVRVCNMIGLMGLRGISVLESSGDGGVGAGCTDAQNNTIFQAIFPATCPYVTAVGGTVATNSAWLFSSGGFSGYFLRPLYQELAVETYLNTYLSPESKKYYEPYTNFTGRGFPDISARSSNPGYLGFYDGSLGLNGGTSASAPIVAGIIGLLNDARFRAGKPALGFLNPGLYTRGFAGLNDVTYGGSIGCFGIDGNETLGGIVPYASWNATIGWDPVTGLGSPDFQKLKAIALAI